MKELRCLALLFDLDGVLVDSARCVEMVLRRWAAKHGLDAEAIIPVAHGRRTIETVGLVAPHLDAQRESDALGASESVTTDGVFEVPGARELVAALPRDRWAVVTSGIRAVATLRMRHTRIPEPGVLVCADDIAHGKPHPEGYLTAARRLGIAPADCIVVEDAIAGLEAADAAGMRSIGIAGTYPANALRRATVVIPSLAAMQVEVLRDELRVVISDS